MRYIVLAFYPNLGIKVRVTEYSRKNEMYEYIGALRICETPYIAMDTKTNITLDMETYGEDREKLAKLVEEM